MKVQTVELTKAKWRLKTLVQTKSHSEASKRFCWFGPSTTPSGLLASQEQARMADFVMGSSHKRGVKKSATRGDDAPALRVPSQPIKAMNVDKKMLQELLLVSGALGSTETEELPDGTVAVRFIRGKECLQWLQDLQRAIRQDNESTRDICIQLASYNVLSDKLVPLLLQSQDDSEVILTLLRIFVMLTLPLTPAAIEASKASILPDQGGSSSSSVKKKTLQLAEDGITPAMLRAKKENAYLQVEALLKHKVCFDKKMLRGEGGEIVCM